MQTTTTTFRQLAAGHVRPLAWQLRMSFDKAFDDNVIFFELDTSLLDGTDVLTPSDANVVQEWDKYEYLNYSNRVTQLEWIRENDLPYSVNLAMADITLNNYDSYFTRGSSALDPNILPRRPVRILSGFKNTTLPQFVGLTETVPKIDKSNRTATVHCVDFLSYLFTKPLDQTIMLENYRTDEVLAYLLQLFGLSASQYTLDEGINIIKFVYFPKGKNFGEACRELMQAELGTLYMDELGMIVFKNRVNIETSSVYTFNSSNIINYQLSDETKIINDVRITSNVREVQPLQEVYTISEPIQILAGQTLETFFNLSDPITSLDTVNDYLANSQADGDGTNLTSNIVVNDVDQFATAVKIEFENTGVVDAWITELKLNGTPAKVIGDPLYVRIIDQNSIDAFEERVEEINNDFIQDLDTANSIGLSLLNYYSDYANTIELDVKGTPALQLKDNITVQIDDIDGIYTITKIVNIIEAPGRYIQRITATQYNIPAFFTISSDVENRSLLNETDVLSP